MARMSAFGLIVTVCVLAGCTAQSPVTEQTIQHFALDDLDGVITRTGITLDAEQSIDGGGALRVAADGHTVVRLFEVRNVDVEQARLLYRARLRTENLDGRAYLEMWCHVPGQGEFFSRGLATPLTGTQDWTTGETVFFLKKGENPDYVKLNLVVEGTGTAWIDDIHLVSAPLS